MTSLGDTLSVEVVAGETGGVLVLRGEIDMATAPALTRAVDALAISEVTLDLREVEFIDSAGIRELALLCRPGLPTAIRLLVEPGSHVERVLDMAQMLAVLPVEGRARDVR